MKCPKCRIRGMSYYASIAGRFLYCKCGNTIELKSVYRKKPKRAIKPKRNRRTRIFIDGEWKPKDRTNKEVLEMMNNPKFTFYMLLGKIVSKVGFSAVGEGGSCGDNSPYCGEL